MPVSKIPTCVTSLVEEFAKSREAQDCYTYPVTPPVVELSRGFWEGGVLFLAVTQLFVAALLSPTPST